MTPERAKEILQAGAQWCNWGKKVTPEEDKFINYIWDHMPGYSSWYDALCRIAKGPEHYKIVLYNNSIKGIIIEKNEQDEIGIRLENGNFVWATENQITRSY